MARKTGKLSKEQRATFEKINEGLKSAEGWTELAGHDAKVARKTSEGSG